MPYTTSLYNMCIIVLAIQGVCHSINGPGISGPGGPFMLDIVSPPGPLMPKHKWSY